MKIIGVILAIGVLAAILVGIGYGLVTSYEVLSVNWNSLDDEWHAVLIVMATVIVLTALFVTYVLARTIRYEARRSVGRVEAYNAFVVWYSALTGHTGKLPDAATLLPVKNGMMLWGSNRVVRQINLLHELLAKEGAEPDLILEKAGHVFLEIKRELGHRSPGVDRKII